MAGSVTVDGVKYPIVESLGFVHDIGQMAWVVRMPDGSERKAVGAKARARFWGAADRVAPLLRAAGARVPPGGGGC